MPKATKKQSDPCDDWEDQDYDSPTSDPIPPTSDQLSSDQQPLSSSSTTPHSKDPLELENSLMWKNANQNPQYVVLPANAAHSAVTANRPLVQETMFGKAKLTILKRPKGEPKQRSTGDSTCSSSSSNLSISLREKAYLEARERIFGASNSDDLQSSLNPLKLRPSPPLSSSPNPVAIHRQPNGPVSSDHKGFNSRQKSLPAS
ncbi:uncharacterized protein VP01_5071g1 [Puccinia sorghi]|uniref:SUZ domain-containing protein n=1 Tax=Puccinia sorghi TaxID=27349 RepID=A0A0L6ULF2_9BASI|nr:uncharacterized protein VP01_5071g1 [Puccinia sorghi]